MKILSCSLKAKLPIVSLDKMAPGQNGNVPKNNSKKVQFKEVDSEENVLDDSFTGVPIESSSIFRKYV